MLAWLVPSDVAELMTIGLSIPGRVYPSGDFLYPSCFDSELRLKLNMSNAPGDLSADPTGETLPAQVSAIGITLPDQDATRASISPRDSILRADHVEGDKFQSVSSTPLKSETGEEELEEDEDEDQTYVGGVQLRDLSGSQVEQFPGIKREKWWSVA